jgi:hypothetical protein
MFKVVRNNWRSADHDLHEWTGERDVFFNYVDMKSYGDFALFEKLEGGFRYTIYDETCVIVSGEIISVY